MPLTPIPSRFSSEYAMLWLGSCAPSVPACDGPRVPGAGQAFLKLPLALGLLWSSFPDTFYI